MAKNLTILVHCRVQFYYFCWKAGPMLLLAEDNGRNKSLVLQILWYWSSSYKEN